MKKSQPAKTEYDRLMDRAAEKIRKAQTLLGSARRLIPSAEMHKANARVNDALHAIQGVSRQADFVRVQ